MKYEYQKIAQAMNSDKTPDKVFKIISECIDIKSIIDIGCGYGWWLSVAKESGVSDLTGVEIDENRILEAEKICGVNVLKKDLRQPLSLSRRYDLCVFYEVAEHLPVDRAKSIIGEIVKLSDVILFSAATPFQGGMKLPIHLNEQWPTYWETLFEHNGYSCLDVVRPAIWDDDEVGYYKRANVFLYVKKEIFYIIEDRFRNKGYEVKYMHDVVHPLEYLNIYHNNEISLFKLVRKRLRRFIEIFKYNA